MIGTPLFPMSETFQQFSDTPLIRIISVNRYDETMCNVGHGFFGLYFIINTTSF
jgi:hypothetical protein